MTEHPVTFRARPTDSPEVAARLAALQPRVDRVVAATNQRMRPQLAEFNRRAAAIMNSDTPTEYKIPAIWAFADDVMSTMGKDAACKRGCSHCCHIAVGVMEPEAKVIGKMIGRPPVAVKGRQGPGYFDGFDYGYHNPCTFLKNGECSIYEFRPLACRAQFNVDVDDLLCRLTPPHSVTVPYLDTHNLQMMLAATCMRDGVPKLADIREYFP